MSRDKNNIRIGVTGPGPVEPVHVLHRDLSTQNQIGMLLSVSKVMMEFLSSQTKDAENIPGSRPLPGESRLAAEATLIKACNQLDHIIEDPQRWGMEYQLSLEKFFRENGILAREVAEKQSRLLETELARAEAQRDAALEIKSPHFQYKPRLLELEEGGWVAFIGDPNNEASGIVGVGKCPADALRAFDLVFSGQLTEEQKKTVEQEVKQQTEVNENDTLDSQRTETTEGNGGAGGGS